MKTCTHLKCLKTSQQVLGYLSLLSVIVLLLAGTATAQSKKKPLAQPLKLKIYTWLDESKSLNDQAEIPELYYNWRNKYHLLKLRNAETTRFFEAARFEGRLHFYKKITTDDDKVIYKSAVSVSIKPSIKEVFLYFFNSAKKVNLLPIDLSKRKFPKRSMSFYNQSAKDVILTMNGKKVKAAAKKVTVIRYKENEKQTARIVVQTFEKQPKNLTVMTVGMKPAQRLIGFFYPSARGNYRLLLERGADSQAHKFR